MEGHRAFGAGAQDYGAGVGGEAGGGDEAGGFYRPLKIAAIYARVSTERQEKEQTVDSQLDALRWAAEEGGYEVAPSHIFVMRGEAALTWIARAWTACGTLPPRGPSRPCSSPPPTA